MNLKELIKDVERLKEATMEIAEFKLYGIKQTVEAVDNSTILSAFVHQRDKREWIKLKKLLEIK